jgi:hypothetical protein
VKRVHYMAAAMAGVLPAVTAGVVGAAPANAQVLAPAKTAAKTVKTVPQYNHNQCTGTIETPKIYSGGNAFNEMHFWFTHSGAQTCIGTIFAEGIYDVSKFRVRMWYGNNLWYQSYAAVNHATSLQGQTYHWVSTTIRIKAPNPVLVCGAFFIGNTMISHPMCYQV